MSIKQQRIASALKALLVVAMTLAFIFSAPLLQNTGNNTALAADNSIKTCPTTTGVLVENGNKLYCNTCNINGNNYFKLRDLACLLNNTDSEFNVGWNNARNAITINTNCGYNSTAKVSTANKTTSACPVTAKLYIDGKAVNLKAYNIGGNTYFKLRDIATQLGLCVGWNQTAKTVTIDTNGTCGNNTSTNTGNTNANNGSNNSGSNNNANSGSQQTPSQLTTQAEQVLYYTNLERTKNGLSELKAATSLDAAAAKRALEIVSTFSHTRPNGTQCFTVLSEMNIRYRTAGENIAMGQPDAKSVVTAWMNSEGHRANILNSSFTKLGVGVYKDANGRMYWAQMFIGD